jgi:hypothetical protein
MRSTIQDGAFALLGETTEILNENGVEYIIVGGWSPFLLNQSLFPHPGTKDVDILFKSGTKKGELESLIRNFLKNGFIQSAKHNFQLLKAIEINGLKFMFHIDLLHPDNQETEPQMYVDHIDFPVKESLTMRVDYKGKTIRLPKSDFFFNDFITKHKQEFELTDGRKKIIEFNLLNEAGLILSKTKSAFNEKRTRDAYDIFLAIKQNRNYDYTIEQLKSISKEHKEIFSAIEKMYTLSKLQILDKNIYEWLSNVGVSESDRETENIFIQFFKDLNIEIGEDLEKR